jgi:hypothetical protein
MIHGKGVIRFGNGNVYNGEFNLNEIEGYGKGVLIQVSLSGRTKSNIGETG